MLRLCVLLVIGWLATRAAFGDDLRQTRLPESGRGQPVAAELALPASDRPEPTFFAEVDTTVQPHLAHLGPTTKPSSGGSSGKSLANDSSADTMSQPYWFEPVAVGYDNGFVIASGANLDLQTSDAPFSLRMNGWGQLRHSVTDYRETNHDLNQFQLKRGRLAFSGSAFRPTFAYFVQLDGRSSSGDDVRLLDYYLTFDTGRHLWGWEPGTFGMKTGKYKVPVTMARDLSGREFEFSDRSMASMYFDVNRSFAWGAFGKTSSWAKPLHWEIALFNGLVTGGAETGSSGTLDDNFAVSARVFLFPTGEWGTGGLADFDGHDYPATRVGAGLANSTIDRSGQTEFDSIRVVDSGDQLSALLPLSVDQYSVNICSVDASCKYRGWSLTTEYYLRNIYGIQGAALPDLIDHGFWLQLGKFVLPGKLQVLARWSRVAGKSGTLGAEKETADEFAGGCVWYFRGQHAKAVFDVTHLDGAPINSSSLDISPGDIGWLYRTQIQFAF